MRLEVTIPDQLYSHAQRLAAEAGVSFDRFISDAVALRLEDEAHEPKTTPELTAILRQAETDIDAGRGLTVTQVEQRHAAKRAAWIRANPH